MPFHCVFDATRQAEWPAKLRKKSCPSGKMVERIFESDDDWLQGRMRKDIVRLLKAAPPPIENLDPVLTHEFFSGTSSAKQIAARSCFWELSRLLGCDAKCPYFFNSQGGDSTCRRDCHKGIKSGVQCADCHALASCSYYGNPILRKLRPFYSLWANLSYSLRRMILVGVLFGDGGGRRSVGGRDPGYWLCDIARMAGVPENRASEYAERLERLGVIEKIEVPPRSTYRFVGESDVRAWRSAESEHLRRGIREILSNLQEDLARNKSFVEGADYVPLRGRPRSSFDACRPRVVLGKIPPKCFLSMLVEFDKALHVAVITTLRSGCAMIDHTREEEMMDLREALYHMADRVVSAYSDLTAEDLRQMSKYLGSLGYSHGPKTLVLYSLT